jgi:glycosyltransferase involved in cell wall biosynthesis
VEGFLIEPGDHHALAERLIKLIENPELRVQMGERGRQVVVDNFSTVRMVGDREKLFLSLAAGKGIPADIYSMQQANPK